MSDLSAIATAERPRLPHLAFGPFAFDRNSRMLRRGSQELALPPRVLGILELLLQRAGEVVPRQELIDAVWKDAFVTDTSLAEAVSFLRQALGDDPQSPTYVQTVHRRGYRFVAPVSSPDAPAVTPRASPAAPIDRGGFDRVSPSIARELVPWSAAVLFGALAVAAVWQLVGARGASAPPVVRFPIETAAGTLFDGRGPAIALSRDGRQIVWSACDASGCRLYLRRLDRIDAAAIAGTDGASTPFFSPDGRWIAFFADGKLKKIAVAGGAALTLADVPESFGGAWSDSGAIVFSGSRASGLMRIPDQGGEPQPLTVPREDQGEVRHAWPAFAADGRTLIFTIATAPSDSAPGRVGVLTLDAAGRQPAWTSWLAGVVMARPSVSGSIVFSRGGDLQAVTFDRTRLALSGTPQTVVSGVGQAVRGSHFALADSGALAYAERTPANMTSRLLWWSASGIVGAADTLPQFTPTALAPDGHRIAGVMTDGERSDIWAGEIDRGAITRLTHEGLNIAPVWSPDGRTVYFSRRVNAAFEIWTRDAAGATPARRLLGGARHVYPLSVSPDGSVLTFEQSDDRGGLDLWALPLAVGGQPRPLVRTPFDETAAAFSPDGRLLTYQSNETGRWDVYVQRLSDGSRAIVSTGGGVAPAWSGDGKAIYYRSGDRFMSAAVDVDLHAAAPAMLARIPGAVPIGASADGRVLFEAPGPPAPGRGVIVLEWNRELRQLLGPPATALPR
jgi:DNA-binding winged helix-turn-helix (wHTH) protein/Tol biopolymer transport system component